MLKVYYIILYAGVIQLSYCQLFPFSNLKHFIDQKGAEHKAIGTRPPTPALVPFKNLDDDATQTAPTYDQPPSFYDRVPDLRDGGSSPVKYYSDDPDDERTILVTPKPKYTPSKLIPEPDEEPNSHKVPSMGYRGSSSGIIKIETPEETTKGSGKVPISSPSEYSPAIDSGTTYVESVPSLSVKIPNSPPKTHGLVDYLVPPKYPSVYQDYHVKSADALNGLPNAKETFKSKPSPQFPAKVKKATKGKDSVHKKPTDFVRDVPSEKRPIRVRPLPVAPERPVKKRQNKRPAIQSVKPQEEPLTSSSNDNRHNYYNELTQFAGDHHSSEEGLAGPSGDRVEFQMHGQNGPESYKFGYDTGKGENRQFRYEEKDSEGNIKGHYGYYDEHGKLQVVNYQADKDGFHASPAS